MPDDAKDAARWREFAARANDTTTSEWNHLMQILNLVDDTENFDLGRIFDAAIAARATEG